MASNRWLYGDTFASPPKPTYIRGNKYRVFLVAGDYKFVGIIEYPDGARKEYPAQTAAEAYRAACLDQGELYA